MKNLLKRWGYLTSFILIIACSENHESPQPTTLVESAKILNRSSGELQSFLKVSGLDINSSLLKYNVDLYRVTYNTTYKGAPIKASGLVIFPKTTDAVGMVSFQHGTIVAHSDAPSEQPINSTELILYAALGSSGFIGVIPDYIGFGASSGILHPYYVEEPTADAIIDNLRAARELAQQKGINFNQKLFLAGYSQGGYATMAAHKSIETSPLVGFDLIASFPASGGYDIKGVQEYFFRQQRYDQPHYIAYVAMAYQSYYKWGNNTMGQFFNEPYASRIPTLFNGTLTVSDINAQLTETIADLIQPNALAHIDSDPQYAYLTDQFRSNSLLDLTPHIPMHMYHGDADATVPYQNSVDTYNYFIEHGASTDIVTFTTLPGADHASGITPYLEHLIDEVTKLK